MVEGQCCPSSCEPIPTVDPAAQLDAGTCVSTPAPACNTNAWPHCAPDWSTAESWFEGCPSPDLPVHLAQCGSLHAIVVRVPLGSRRFFYDPFGTLVGFESTFDDGTASCTAYAPGFELPAAPCVPLGDPCPDAGSVPPLPDLEGIGADAFITWEGDAPDCATGQAAYDAFLAAQLASFNTCSGDAFCASGGLGVGPSNACLQPCNLVLSPAAINSQILARLDTFGTVACARCENGPGAGCPLSPGLGRCITGHCFASTP